MSNKVLRLLVCLSIAKNNWSKRLSRTRSTVGVAGVPPRSWLDARSVHRSSTEAGVSAAGARGSYVGGGGGMVGGQVGDIIAAPGAVASTRSGTNQVSAENAVGTAVDVAALGGNATVASSSAARLSR